jgi:hypothetical protein
VATRKDMKEDGDLDREIERYRQAAIDALGQLEWCIGYLHELRKAELAKQG